MYFGGNELVLSRLYGKKLMGGLSQRAAFVSGTGWVGFIPQ